MNQSQTIMVSVVFNHNLKYFKIEIFARVLISDIFTIV